jgi:hypothetical protein
MIDHDPTEPRQTFALALRSPALVGTKDKAGWVALFHAEGFVEDPVEAGRYAGSAKISLFWDVFIGPQPSVAFAVKRDFCGLRTLIRQATVVSVTEADPEAVLPVPALIAYTLRDGLVGSLQAVWEPRQVIAWFFGRRFAGLRALGRHGARMMGRAGLGNGLRFGMTLAGGLRRDDARALVLAIASGDADQWSCPTTAKITIGCETAEDSFDGAPVPAIERLQAHASGALARLVIDQLVICGHHIGAFLVDPDGEGGLALMLRVKRGEVAAMTALWSATRRVLG